jgi:hypothetical protein
MSYLFLGKAVVSWNQEPSGNKNGKVEEKDEDGRT